MNRALTICVGLMLVATYAQAQGVNGLHMTWSACSNSSGSRPGLDMSCTRATGVVYPLIGTFGLATAVPGVVAMDGIIDLHFWQPAEVGAFWQFQVGGCNQSGLVLTDARPTSCDRTANSGLLCGSVGQVCETYVAYGFGADFGFPPDRGRLVFTLYRPTTTLVDLPATTSPTAAHFAFEFDFAMDNAPGIEGDGCLGCYSGVDLVWTDAYFYNTSSPNRPEGVAAHLTNYDPGSQDAAVVANPGVVATRSKTWGRLKSLYR